MMWDGFGGWGGMGFGFVWMLLFWALVIGGIVLLVRWLASSPGREHASAPRETALDVLKRRYASSEIGREEFEQRKRDLQP
jgi:putative membrane protein